MNVNPPGQQNVDPRLWEQPDMRQALAGHDITTVFQILGKNGMSQRVIAMRTGQSQSEVSDIVSRGRQVMAYEVLSRIADGLGIPRSYMGLAYDTSSAHFTRAAAPPDEDRDDQARSLLAYAAQITVGAAEGNPGQWTELLPHSATPVPERIGIADVARIESVTRTLRALDYQHGGGMCRPAVVAQVAWSQRLLRASDSSSEVTHRLHRALADQHNLAGWISFDVGLYQSAREHLARALEQARHANDPSLMANILYRMGRIYLHCGRVQEALRFFQLGQIRATDCERTVAMLHANEAWAYALLGNVDLALKSMLRACDELARADAHPAPSWVNFFGYSDLAATGGMVHANLGPAHLEAAVAELTKALAGRDARMTRSRVFELTALATVYLRANDITGIDIGNQALSLAKDISSLRVIDRLAPLREAAMTLAARHSDARDLAQRISTLRTA